MCVSGKSDKTNFISTIIMWVSFILLIAVLIGFGCILLNVANIYRKTTSVEYSVDKSFTYDNGFPFPKESIRMASELMWKRATEARIQHLSEQLEALDKTELGKAEKRMDGQIATIDSYTAKINLNLALIAIVVTVVGVIVTALSIGLSINLTIKDEGLRKQIKEAEESLEKMAKLDKDLNARVGENIIAQPTTLDDLYRNGNKLYEQKEFVSAIRCYKDALPWIKIDDHEKLSEVHYKKARSFEKLWEEEKSKTDYYNYAIAGYEQAIETKPIKMLTMML